MRMGWLAAVLIVAAAPAVASPCSSEIETLSKRVEAQSHAAIASGSSGQGDAAARGGQGLEGAAGEARPREKSAEAGEGADKAQAARVALDEARTADSKGDAKACEEALARVKKSLAAAP